MNLTKVKFWHIHAAGAAGLAVLAALAYAVGVRPVLGRRDAAAAQGVRLTECRQEAQELSGVLAQLQQELSTVQTALADNPIRLHPAREVNARIARLADLAAECGMKIDQIEPGQETRGPKFQTVPIRLLGGGTYPMFVKLLRSLRDVFPDTAVASFELSGTPDNPQIPPRFQLNLLWHSAITDSVETP